MWSPAGRVELRWYQHAGRTELQFRQVLSHANGWEPDKWGDWEAVPLVVADEEPCTDPIRAIIHEEIGKALSRYNMRDLVHYGIPPGR